MEQIKDHQTLLNEALRFGKPYVRYGKPASYIPELAKADTNDFGICVTSENGKVDFAGDYDKLFTMQSIVKPIILLLALMDNRRKKAEELAPSYIKW